MKQNEGKKAVLIEDKALFNIRVNAGITEKARTQGGILLGRAEHAER
jgi:hypothetical protein